MKLRKILAFLIFLVLPLFLVIYYYILPSVSVLYKENISYAIIYTALASILTAMCFYYVVNSEYFKRGLIFEYYRDYFIKPVLKSKADRILIYFVLFTIFLIAILYILFINYPELMFGDQFTIVFVCIIIILIIGGFVARYLSIKSKIELLKSKDVKR